MNQKITSIILDICSGVEYLFLGWFVLHSPFFEGGEIAFIGLGCLLPVWVRSFFLHQQLLGGKDSSSLSSFLHMQLWFGAFIAVLCIGSKTYFVLVVVGVKAVFLYLEGRRSK